MAADIRTFWGALLSVLLKCIAALGFSTANRAADRRSTPVAGATAEAAAQVAVEAREKAAVGAVPAPVGPPAPQSRRGAGVRIPAQRAGGSRLTRRSRGRTLPPTMKQRIGAEAHGASPSARSLRTADAADEFGDLAALAALTDEAAGRSADRGMDRGIGRGMDRGADQHLGRGPGRAAGRSVGADGRSQQGKEAGRIRPSVVRPFRELFARAA